MVRRLHSRDDADMYITGSGARLLSGELATHLTGRRIIIPVHPLSFDEYQRHHQVQETTDSTDQLFSRYMMFGGMSGLFVVGQPDQDRAAEILTSIYESIVLKDMAGRYDIRDITTLEKLNWCLFSTSGNLFSVSNAANTLASAGANASYITVNNQISALERSFIVYNAQRERMWGRELLCPQRKLYPVDNSFHNFAAGFNGSDHRAQPEGIVSMELQRRGYDIAIGSLSDGEIDFIAKRGNDEQYIQVTLNMTEEQTRERELVPLRRLGDAFPRTVLILDWHSEGMTDEGTHITNVMGWFCS